MNCESVAEQLTDLVAGNLSPLQLADCKRHLDSCSDCADALIAVESLDLIKNRTTGEPPVELFDRLRTEFERAPQKTRGPHRFWSGAGFGGAIAASFFAVALVLGFFETPRNAAQPEVAEFSIAQNEPRTMDIAIEADRQLQNASITILLSGGIELEGYAGQRELSWTSDLDAGVNRLSLPIVAIGDDGGKMIVRLSHPKSEQVFIVDLKTGI